MNDTKIVIPKYQETSCSYMNPVNTVYVIIDQQCDRLQYHVEGTMKKKKKQHRRYDLKTNLECQSIKGDI